MSGSSPILTLGIETSCDETAVALYHAEQGLLAHQIYSQIPLHQHYGGVVPELAARDHLLKLSPLLETVLKTAGVSLIDVTGIGYTAGPGLIGALFVGAFFARSLAYARAIPAIGVHHLEGHLMAPMLSERHPNYPFLALLVSGGHTQIIHVKAFGAYTLMGDTLDDACGEAFDKSAKLLDLPYPGGPALAKLALQGDPNRFKLTRPMVNRQGLDFSFSGLKTQVRETWQACAQTEKDRADLAAATERAIVDTLVIKVQRALKCTRVSQVVIAGGVSANLQLREKLQRVLAESHVDLFYPPFDFCTDNAAMIAYVAHQRLQAGQSDDLSLNLRARWPLSDRF